MSRQPESGSTGTHLWPVRVYYEDTDAGGVVYYANYLRFVERARTEMLREARLDHVGLERDTGAMLVVRRCALEFFAPARLDDLLEVRSRVTTMSGASFAMIQDVFRSGNRLAEAKLTLVCIDRRLRPVRLPAALKERLAKLTLTD